MAETWGENDKPVQSVGGAAESWGENDKPIARGFGGWARAGAGPALKGGLAVPEAAVGPADLSTSGRGG